MTVLTGKDQFKRKHPVAVRVLRTLLAPFRKARDLPAVRRLRGYRRFRKDFRGMARSIAATGDDRFALSWTDRMPVLQENTPTSGFDPHYVYHTSWAARLLSMNRPARHHDFASDIRFATLVSAFVPITFHDLRPLEIELSNLTSKRADLLNLEMGSGTLSSLSCMHVIEHVGLGRYGDQMDCRGDLKAIGELKRVLAPGGDLYFVVPIGRPRLMFNAHRIYSFAMILDLFSDLVIKDFSLVTDEGRFVLRAEKNEADQQRYGCGCFWFRK